MGRANVIYVGQDEVAANTVAVKDLSSRQQVKMLVDQGCRLSVDSDIW